LRLILTLKWLAKLQQKPKSNENALASDVALVSAMRFKRHVATHQEQLAIFVVPRMIEDQGEYGDDAGASSIDASVSAREDPLTDKDFLKEQKKPDVQCEEDRPVTTAIGEIAPPEVESLEFAALLVDTELSRVEAKTAAKGKTDLGDQIRIEAEEVFLKKMQEIGQAQEKAKFHAEIAMLDATHAARERTGEARQAEEERAREYAKAMIRAEQKGSIEYEELRMVGEKARARIEDVLGKEAEARAAADKRFLEEVLKTKQINNSRNSDDDQREEKEDAASIRLEETSRKEALNIAAARKELTKEAEDLMKIEEATRVWAEEEIRLEEALRRMEETQASQGHPDSTP
jgi:hypothetical protein